MTSRNEPRPSGATRVAGHYDEAEDALVFIIVVSAAALVLIAVANHY